MKRNNEVKTLNTVFIVSKELEEPKTSENGAADFETAITATGFGKFNIILMIIAIPSGMSSIFETTTMSYVFPAAQCDLELTLANKGSLNAITYAGMISSAFVWGFLCDTLGRKRLLLAGFFLDGIFVIMSGLAQNITVLMVAKFLGGFVINGPFAALTAYLAEFHCARHRARVQMSMGIVFSTGNALLPLLGWAILPLDLNLRILNLDIHPWNVYLIICCLPAMLSAVGFLFLPESPKFLMTVGRNEQALQVFRKVYSFNTGKPPESYPVKELIEETKIVDDDDDEGGGGGGRHRGQVTANRSQLQALKEGWQQIAPLFFPPHLTKIILVCALQMLFMMSLNTLRLWLPQIFQAINDYEYYNNGTTASICTMLQVFRPAKLNFTEKCVVNLNNDSVYINSIIVAFVTICGYIAVGLLINTLGKKRLLNILGLTAGTCAMCIYFAHNTLTTVALAAVFVSLASICVNVVLAVVVDLFPTTLRTMCVALTMMVGRVGAMSGNLVFPVLLRAGCAPPFFSVGTVLTSCAFLSLLLQNTDLKALK